LDRLRFLAAMCVLLAAAGCGHGGRPRHLLHGETAADFRPVRGSVIVSARALRGTVFGRRFRLCRPRSVSAVALVLERIGVFSESLTFSDRHHRILYACDGGLDPAGEHRPPWCGASAGLLVDGRLLDPRLDITCRDRQGHPLAYAWVQPRRGVRWIGVDQGSYTEMYEVLAGLPVRIATERSVDVSEARASFDVREYDAEGRELVRTKLEAEVAG
jgi:hypothetical protein